MEKSYLLKIDNKVVERPQHMLMRVSVGIHGADIDRAIETYNLMSEKWFIHATPTLFNSGTERPQLSRFFNLTMIENFFLKYLYLKINLSCFLLAMRDDSIEGIFDTLKQCSIISKNAGGIGLHVHNIRCNGSRIAGVHIYYFYILYNKLKFRVNENVMFVWSSGLEHGI